MIDPQPPRPGAAASSRVPTKGAIAGGLATASVAALALAIAGLKPDEGKRNVDYVDLAGIPSACYGHTGAGVRVGTRRTDAQCEALLNADVAAEQRGVAQCVPALTSRPYQWAASTRLAHNIGVPAFCHSGAAIHFNRGDWRGGCDLFRPWDKARVHGQLVPVLGLTLRRERERAQCLTRLAA